MLSGHVEQRLGQIDQPAGQPQDRALRPEADIVDRPDRCGCVRCEACPGPVRPAPAVGARRRCECPHPPAKTRACRLSLIPDLPETALDPAVPSAPMIPCRPSIRTCATDPRISSNTSRVSNEIDDVYASLRASGALSNRPDHASSASTPLNKLSYHLDLLPICRSRRDRRAAPIRNKPRRIPSN